MTFAAKIGGAVSRLAGMTNVRRHMEDRSRRNCVTRDHGASNPPPSHLRFLGNDRLPFPTRPSSTRNIDPHWPARLDG
jgi:hypothetical protein